MALVIPEEGFAPLLIEAKLTAHGVESFRIPGAKEGDRFQVHSLTPGAHVGDYWNCHVKDAGGNIWTLGEGDWIPASSIHAS